MNKVSAIQIQLSLRLDWIEKQKRSKHYRRDSGIFHEGKMVGQKYTRQIDYHRFKLFKLAQMFMFSENATEEHA